MRKLYVGLTLMSGGSKYRMNKREVGDLEESWGRKDRVRESKRHENVPEGSIWDVY